MALADWTAKYETGYIAVDEQHKYLFSLINDLHDALMTGKGKEKMGTALKSLATYVIEHFRTEETLMSGLSYPGIIEHRRKHEELANQVSRLVDDHDTGKLTLPLTLARFLSDWLTHHIEAEDMRMIAWIKAKG